MATSNLPPVRRIVTGHTAEAVSVVAHDSELKSLPGSNVETRLLWSSESSPADIAPTDDRGDVQMGLYNNGSSLRIVDFPPKSVGFVHRTITLDYLVVLKGTITLTLDDGSRTQAGEGTVLVQQGTMHGWDNETDEWARLLCVLLPAKAPVINGKELVDDLPFKVG